jgi:signal transduction histidine kinase
MPLPSPNRIATWLPLSLVAFALLGSAMLVWVFLRFAEREDRTSFTSLAQANAAFLKQSTLPKSEKMAAQLTTLLGVTVWFQQGTLQMGSAPAELPPNLTGLDHPQKIKGLLVIGIALPGDGQPISVYFARPARPSYAVFLRVDTWVILGAFWLLAALFGILIARHVTRPLTQLTQTVPLLAQDNPLPALPTHRSDEIGQLALSFQNAHTALASERQRRTEAATSLAHEVRNPLAAIRLHAQLLEGATDSERRQSQQLIQSETARIEDLVSQWLHFARPSPPALVPVDLAAVQARTCQLLQPQATHAQVRLIPASDSSPPTVLGDPNRLHQALSNLVLNALQATPAMGVVRLDLQQTDTHLCLQVHDTGPGFSEEALLHGGDPFFSEREGGMGLGLAVALEITLAHHGSLTWENNDTPPGAVVTIRLPLPPPI